jgi:Asp-tRNA(Asn)/Glu-tRNA(Gln) amidotransferase A subunit family amidase
MTSHPAASLPCGFTDDGLPVGMQVVGRRFREVDVLRLAARFEEAAPWGDHRPAFPELADRQSTETRQDRV